MSTPISKAGISPQALVLPLALAQFICSYAGSNMNVAINDIAKDLNTPVHSVQVVISLFMLTMAALMIPGSKLTDIWGRKFCFMLGLIVYGAGGLVAALAPNIGILTIGYALGEGIGTALLIPPVYIVITVAFKDVTERAKWFGVVTGAGGIGAAAGPLIGGVVTTTISWRASFILQVLVVATIIVLARRVTAHLKEEMGAKPHFDLGGAVLSGAGLFFLVLGFLMSGTYGWWTATKDFTIGSVTVISQGGISPVWLSEAVAGLLLLWFFHHIGALERAGKEPLLRPRMFQNRASNLGLVTQNVQWLVLQGGFFVISVFLQTVRGENAIKTGLILTPATIGILLASALAQRMAQRRSQSTLIRAGFVLTIAGIVLLLLMVTSTSNVITFVPGLLLEGIGLGMMLTASVNVVQSAFPEKDQGEISGLSRSVSNLGSSLGTSLVGSILVSTALEANKNYAAAMIALAVIAGIGLIAALLLPAKPAPATAGTKAAAPARPQPAK